MSSLYTNELCVIGDNTEIERVMPSLIESGWWPTDRDRLCVKLYHRGEALGLPDCVKHNFKLQACLNAVADCYNTVSLETSALLFETYKDFRGGQGELCPVFDGKEPSDIEMISPKAAREIAEFSREVTLPKVTSLTLEAAEVLACHRGMLSFPGLRQIDPLVAKAFARHIGWLCLDGLEALPKNVAEELAWCRASLSLNGLKDVSPAAIEVLAAGQPHPEHAKYGYTTRSFGDLKLDGLQELSRELARAIARHPRNISLNGLRDLGVLSARELAAERTGFLLLGGIGQLSELAAEALGQTSAGLILSGLTTITPRTAGGLAQTTGGLFLNGLKELSPAVAKRLAEHRGHLGLWSVTSASDEVLDALSQHDGPVVLGINGGMTLRNDSRLAAPLETSRA